VNGREQDNRADQPGRADSQPNSLGTKPDGGVIVHKPLYLRQLESDRHAFEEETLP